MRRTFGRGRRDNQFEEEQEESESSEPVEVRNLIPIPLPGPQRRKTLQHTDINLMLACSCCPEIYKKEDEREPQFWAEQEQIRYFSIYQRNQPIRTGPPRKAHCHRGGIQKYFWSYHCDDKIEQYGRLYSMKIQLSLFYGHRGLLCPRGKYYGLIVEATKVWDDDSHTVERCQVDL